MKKLMLITLGMTCAFVLTVCAQESPAKKLTPNQEHQATRKALIEKYDANKTGRLDKEEVAKMTTEDREKWDATVATNKAKAEAAKAKAETNKENAEAKKAAAEAKKAEAAAKKAEAAAKKEANKPQ
jgi:hypothetical protein